MIWKLLDVKQRCLKNYRKYPDSLIIVSPSISVAFSTVIPFFLRKPALHDTLQQSLQKPVFLQVQNHRNSSYGHQKCIYVLHESLNIKDFPMISRDFSKSCPFTSVTHEPMYSSPISLLQSFQPVLPKQYILQLRHQ